MDEADTGREHWKILLTSGMGFFTDAYDLFIIGVALKLMKDEWTISTFEKATVSSLALLTSAAGWCRWSSQCRAPDWSSGAVFALPGYALAAGTVDRIGRKVLQVGGFIAMAGAFALLWVIPSATSTLVTFIILFGATYFFSEFGPNTTTFVYPAEIFPVHVRTTSHGIAAAAGKIGAFIGAASMGTLLTGLGLRRTSLIVAAVALAGAFVTLLTLPEPRGKSLEDMGPDGMPSSAVTLGLAESRGTRPAPATSRRLSR
jgi:MFS family permease